MNVSSKEISRHLPLSHSQLRVWFLDRLQGGDPAYHTVAAFRLKGPLDVAALRRSFLALMRRQDSLRTSFPEREGEPFQCISLVPALDFITEEITDSDQSIIRLCEEVKKPFDLASGPLLRVRLFKLGDLEHMLLVVVHHTITDGWSMAITNTELSAFYTAETTGSEPELSDLPMQYSDYTRWQHQWLESEEAKRQTDYWLKELAGAPAVLELPCDHPRPRIRSGRGGLIVGTIDANLTTELGDLGRRNRCTLYMTLLAAFQILLFRYTGQSDLVVGTPVAGRLNTDFEALIGFFVNTVALRGDLSGDPSFDTLLQHTRQTAIRAFEHQELPFEHVVKALEPERQTSHTPIYQTMFAMQPGGPRTLNLVGLEAEPIAVDNQASKFDLLLGVARGDNGLSLRWEFDRDLFDAATIQRLSHHYMRLLEELVLDPSRPLSEIPLLSNLERQRILCDWNDTQRAFPAVTGIHSLFEAQARSTPTQVAVTDGRSSLSYSTLDRLSSGIATQLRNRGAGTDIKIAVCVPRATDLLLALLAVLKSGSAYVPIDPDYPADRIRYILEDSDAQMLLTQNDLEDQLPDLGPERLYLGDLDDPAPHDGPRMPPAPPKPEALAYMIYTSGSTGKPKGVCVEHRSVVNMLQWAVDFLGPDKLSNVLASSSVCFDISVFELFAPLACGGTVSIVDNIFDLHCLPPDVHPTLVNTVPSALQEVVMGSGLPGSVKTVCLAGEYASKELVDLLYAQECVDQVFDLYGPTEATVYATCALRKANAPATIGSSIANTRAYVLDQNLVPVPIGVTGELFLGGAGIARGYWRQADEPDPKFLADPYHRDAETRMYRTGDLVRWKANGELEFLGRRDQQLKIRGFRIDPGEIESTLAEHEDVDSSVVIAHATTQGTRQLLAYVVGSSAATVSETDLRDFLMARLPGYMVPSRFQLLESMPRTSSGKIDRKALPNPVTPAAAGSQGDAPADEVEEALAEIWGSVLGTQGIGIRDNFFELGGDSLTAVRVVNLVEELFGIRLKLMTLFEAPTIETLASRLEAEV